MTREYEGKLYAEDRAGAAPTSTGLTEFLGRWSPDATQLVRIEGEDLEHMVGGLERRQGEVTDLPRERDHDDVARGAQRDRGYASRNRSSASMPRSS